MKREIAFALALAGCASHPASLAPTGPPPVPSPRVTAGALDPRTLLGELPMRASRLGAGAPALVSSTEAIENDWVGGFVDVPSDDCLLAYARGSPSVEDVDVAIYSEEGTQLAADEGRDVHPTVVLCVPHPDRVYVAAHVVGGEGLVAVGAQLVPKERALIVARALGARGAIAEGPRPADAWPGLDDAVRAHRQALGGTWEEVRRVALSVDARVPTYVSLPIEADQCVDAVIVPDTDVALLDIEAFDGEGRVMARAREGMGARTLTVCSPISMPGSLSVRPHVGRGLAAVVVSRARGEVARDFSERPDVAWTAGTQPLEAARGARNALLAKSGYGAPLAAASGMLVLGRRVSIPLDTKALGGACARIDVVAGAPLALVDAHVWDDAGSLLASAEASATLALFACARGAVRLELETRGRPGPFAVSMRRERWQDAAFAAHPLAASRMLARAAAGPDMLLDGKEAPARDVSLNGTRVIGWTENIPGGRCVRVTVGAEGEGAGIELRALDPADGTDFDRSEAVHAASVRACAPAGIAREARFEVRASAGHVDAIVGERTTANQ
ncbi:MAG TPA: hypothetical protein VN894_12490 [Polyangiaceae bacterium]|nr:hypothetical protein [Polyangiaceae bacterium]